MTNADQPAYPYPVNNTEIRLGLMREGASLHGLTKREAFAMAAMQGILANPNCDDVYSDKAAAAVVHADALLKALEA